MHHAIAAIEVVGLDLADILDQLPVGFDHGLPVASLKEIEVAADDAVTFLLEQVDQVSSDVTLMAGDEDFHGMSLSEVVEEGGLTIQTAQDACPDAQSLFRCSRSR